MRKMRKMICCCSLTRRALAAAALLSFFPSPAASFVRYPPLSRPLGSSGSISLLGKILSSGQDMLQLHATISSSKDGDPDPDPDDARTSRIQKRRKPLPPPALFPGMSLAHNFHEMVLGTLVNSDGQDVLSTKVLPLTNKQARRRTRRRHRHRATNTSNHKHSASPRRRIQTLERCDRIPTWPVANGLRCQAIARVNPEMAARLEHNIGGNDCPNLWLARPDPSATSPFLMLVHHNHSFDLADPARWVGKEFLPEGFPSHAHRGMTTVTVCLRGGLVHRDSNGEKQMFGAETSSAKADGSGPYGGKHTQWLTFGEGIVHELMFDNVQRRGMLGQRGSSVVHQEIYQIWVDLPSADRMMKPRVELLGGEEETPSIMWQGTTTTIIAGRHNGKAASVSLTSDLTILRVEMNRQTTWRHQNNTAGHETMILYVRKGSVTIDGESVPAHCTAHLTAKGDVLEVVAGSSGADILLLSGKPLDQNVVARGSMVGETNAELEKAFADYTKGNMGTPWSERFSDSEWKLHVAKYSTPVVQNL